MRAGQVWHWLYHRGVQSFAEMTNIAKDLRQRLDEEFIIGRPEIVTEQVSTDGTRKWLCGFHPTSAGRAMKWRWSIFPEEDRGTLCISSQVGCTLTCSFCHTGTQKLVRNLTAGEIVAQVMTARDGSGTGRRISRPIPRRRSADATSPTWC
jgi:23S rRNA (adenine2503-C2)-methyltransferase